MNISLLIKSIYYLSFLAQIAQPINAGAGLVEAFLMLAAFVIMGFGAWGIHRHQDVTHLGLALVTVIVMAAAIFIINLIFHAAGATGFTITPSTVD